MKSRYTVMSDSNQVDIDGQKFPDPLTFPAERFVVDDKSLTVNLSTQYIKRIDKLMNRVYKVSQYDDIILWLNNVEFSYDLESGDEIELPSAASLESFIRRNKR